MARPIPQFLIAAPTSGSGKTTIARGLMALFRAKGLAVQPYKCGPDYIDTKYHAAVCGRPSVNLDLFMASQNLVREVYAHYVGGADAAVVEGMMGMFDGYQRAIGSSADVARLLDIPVVLVVDAKSLAFSAAPLLSGFINFWPELRIVGVIFNRVGSARHFDMLRDVCQSLQLPCLGYLPKHAQLEQASRYLGLDFSGDLCWPQELISLFDQHIDWQRLLQETTTPCPEAGRSCMKQPSLGNIVVARNEEAFSFIYQEHLDLLSACGNVSFFDPEANEPLPSDTCLLYLPGGYPEKHVKALAAAEITRRSIHDYAEAGGRILAECGGMMYLSKGIICDNETDEGHVCYPMAGVFPFEIAHTKARRKLSLGYRQFQYNGQQLRGHEFHYTQFASPSLPESLVQVYDAKMQPVSTPVFRYRNVIASYTHLYWGETDLGKLF